MTVEVKRQPNESVNAMLRRFTRKVQLSGILLEARKVRFYEKKKKRELRRKEALYRLKKKKEVEEKEKLGLI